jgi:hypothetical protein
MIPALRRGSVLFDIFHLKIKNYEDHVIIVCLLRNKSR